MYFALDAAAQTANSNLPLVLTHSFNTAILKQQRTDRQLHHVFRAPRRPTTRAKMTNLPDLVAPCTLERHGSSTGGRAKFSMVVELQDENRNRSELLSVWYAGRVGLDAQRAVSLRPIDDAQRPSVSAEQQRRSLGRPRTKLVEHFHNEQSAPDTIGGSFTGVDYFGVYSFMEKIKRGPSRVNVEGLSIGDSTTPTIAGGYILKPTGSIRVKWESCRFPGQSFGGMGGNVMPWVYPRAFPDPFKVVNLAQSNWLRGHLGEAWSVPTRCKATPIQ